MIKIICNKCGEEVKSRNITIKIDVTTIRDLLLPPQKGKQQITRDVWQEIYHLCPKCWNELAGQFKKVI
jgi:hypothetical protein